MTEQDERSVANTWETVAGRPRAVVAWMCEGPCRLMSFNTPSPAGGAIWGDYRTFRRWRLAGGSGSLGVGLKLL